MDVVRTNIEKIGGTVDIESTQGQGTTIRTKIPLTLAIIPALIIVSGGERYAIPQVSLLELVRLDPEQALKGIERMHGAPIYRLRGALLPLVFLDEQLELEVTRTPAHDLNIVVLQADDRPFGLVVDAIRDTEEIVGDGANRVIARVGDVEHAALTKRRAARRIESGAPARPVGGTARPGQPRPCGHLVAPDAPE